MQLEQLCVSVELAKEIKENGYPQSAYFVWERTDSWHELGAYEPIWTIERAEMTSRSEDRVAAPTSSEIGEQLPDYIDEKGILTCEKCNDGSWTVEYELMYGKPRFVGTEADARAKMWLYLKKNNLLDGKQ